MIDMIKKKRKEIEESIKNSNLKEKIHIDKNILESLLFDIVFLDENKEAKFLVWSGTFLSKIDLSEVDFNNVVWDIRYKDNENMYYIDNGISEINLSKTNAKIYFSKSYNSSYLTISGCNFEETDLSKSFYLINKDTKYKIYINNSNFKNTKLDLNLNRIKEAYSNNFSDNNFSSIKINEDFIIDNPNNNFSNTKINIIGSNKTDLYDEIYRKENLKKCYFNGSLIDSQIDIKASIFFGSKRKIDKEIKKAREKYKKLISETKYKKRLHIDKKILEDLLFETKEMYPSSKNEIYKIKYLVWSGPFLSKIDLSEINFDNVEWNVDYDVNNYEELDEINNKRKYHNVNIYYLNNIHKIDLSYTNAKIDFNKSIESIIDKKIVLRYCNFEGTNLSNNELNECNIENSNLSNTGIRINDEIWSQLDKYDTNKFFYIQRTNLSNNKFNNTHLIGKYGFNNHIYKCNLDNTGLNIFVDENETIDEVIKDNSIEGCLINGKTRHEFEKINKLNKLHNKIKELESLLDDAKESKKDIENQIRQLKLQLK